jgi:hypothetical protein
MMIKQINALGKVRVEFSESMVDENSGFNITHINNETLEVTVRSASTSEPIDMTWAPESFVNKLLLL